MDASVVIVLLAVIVIVIVVGVGLVVRQQRNPALDVTVPTRPPRSPLGAAVRRALGAGLDESTWETLEEALLAADVGVEASGDIVARVRESKPEDPEEARHNLAETIKGELSGKDRALHLDGSPAVMLVVGVNGTGKTTSIAKLARRFQEDGMTVILAAADTFRAGAAQQLQTWGERVGARVVHGEEGGDPASVAYDGVDSARARGTDVVIIDTAGRLHGKRNLMAELEKIHRVAGGDRVDEVLLVLDATAGQNGLAQVREFSQAVPITGIVLTKLDGTARGGIVIAVERTLGVPVKFVGVGEGLDDLLHFDPDTFVNSLLE
jgi:fused signal recognition particle receptor